MNDLEGALSEFDLHALLHGLNWSQNWSNASNRIVVAIEQSNCGMFYIVCFFFFFTSRKKNQKENAWFIIDIRAAIAFRSALTIRFGRRRLFFIRNYFCSQMGLQWFVAILPFQFFFSLSLFVHSMQHTVNWMNFKFSATFNMLQIIYSYK